LFVFSFRLKNESLKQAVGKPTEPQRLPCFLPALAMTAAIASISEFWVFDAIASLEPPAALRKHWGPRGLGEGWNQATRPDLNGLRGSSWSGSVGCVRWVPSDELRLRGSLK